MASPRLPQRHRADADQRADRRRQRHHVVRVDDSLHVAEHQRRSPAASRPTAGRTPGSATVRGRRAPRHPQQRGERDQRRREQPADLAAELGAEQPEQPGRAAEAAAAAWPPPPMPSPVSAAVEPAEAVVAEGQLQDVVVGRPAEVGPVGGRPSAARSPPTSRPRRSRRRAPASSCQSRRRSRAGPPTGRPAPNPGSTRNACSILVRNAKPSSTPASTSQRVLSRSIARCTRTRRPSSAARAARPGC